MRRDIKLYNLIFPMWSIYFFGLLFPPMLLILLPANFAVDSIMLLLLFQWLKLPEKKEWYKKMILKTWGFGFLADILASGVFVVLSEALSDVFRDANVNVYLSVSSFPSFLFTTAAVVLAGILIYIFQRKFVLKKLEMEEGQKKKIALGMAILTAPYLMYLPPM
ncbi:MAG: hypothetical protein ACI4TP_07715 [Anaerotignum sp.]